MMTIEQACTLAGINTRLARAGIGSFESINAGELPLRDQLDMFLYCECYQGYGYDHGRRENDSLYPSR